MRKKKLVLVLCGFACSGSFCLSCGVDGDDDDGDGLDTEGGKPLLYSSISPTCGILSTRVQALGLQDQTTWLLYLLIVMKHDASSLVMSP